MAPPLSLDFFPVVVPVSAEAEVVDDVDPGRNEDGWVLVDAKDPAAEVEGVADATALRALDTIRALDAKEAALWTTLAMALEAATALETA